MKSSIQRLLVFSKKEQRGIYILAIIIVILLIVKIISPFLYHSDPVQVFEIMPVYDTLFVEREEEKPILNHHSDNNLNYKSDKENRNEVARNEHQEKSDHHRQLLIDLNVCDSAQLTGIRGIGPVFASRIIKYRELLGGYHNTEQLLEVYGMDETRFCNMNDYVVVDSLLLERLDLNLISFKDLLRHPYFDYDMVKEIFNYKSKHDSICSFEVLLSLKTIDSIKYTKILPYLASPKKGSIAGP